LLQYFKQHGVRVLGIEPAANIARVAEAEKGIPTLPIFFGREAAVDLAGQGSCADVILGNNVLAHVPDLNGFVAGVAILLKSSGVAVFEFPYLQDMLEQVEFDTIYHEHQCYFSLSALTPLFYRHALDIVDVEHLEIHGGSLRLSVAPRGQRPIGNRVTELLRTEDEWGVSHGAAYAGFADAVADVKHALVDMLGRLKDDGARIAAYGAAAKGVTLTSYCGIGRQYLDYVVDRSVHKQGKCFPVGALPIYPPGRLREDRPDYALLLTWNFAEEIMSQQAAYCDDGGRFIIPVPRPRIAGRLE
jgi:hypothetical protein